MTACDRIYSPGMNSATTAKHRAKPVTTLARSLAVAAASLAIAAQAALAAQATPGNAPRPTSDAQTQPDDHPLDLLPADAPIALAVRSIDAADAASAELLQAAELTTLSTFKQVLSVLGIRDALDTTRGIAAAVVLTDTDLTPPDPALPNDAASDAAPTRQAGIVVLLPTTQASAFADAMRAQPLTDADRPLGWTPPDPNTPEHDASEPAAFPSPRYADVRRFTFDDATLYTTPAGPGYTAVALRPETLVRLDFTPGALETRRAALAPAMRDAADQSDLTLYIQPPLAARLLRDLAAGEWSEGLVGPRVIAAAEESLNTERQLPQSFVAAADALVPLADQTRAALWTFEPGPRGVRIQGLGAPRPMTALWVATRGAQRPTTDTPTADSPATDADADADPPGVDFSDDPLAGLSTVGWLAAVGLDADRPLVRSLALTLQQTLAFDRLQPSPTRLTSLHDGALVIYQDAAVLRLRGERRPIADASGGDDSEGAGEWREVTIGDVRAAAPPMLRGWLDAALSLLPPVGGSAGAGEPSGPAATTFLVRSTSEELAAATSRELLERTREAGAAASANRLRRTGVAGERMVRAVRRVLPEAPLIEVQVNLGAIVDAAQPWLEERELNLLRPSRYPPLALAMDAREGLLEVTGFVPAAAVQNAFELRRVAPSLMDVRRESGALRTPTEPGSAGR